MASVNETFAYAAMVCGGGGGGWHPLEDAIARAAARMLRQGHTWSRRAAKEASSGLLVTLPPASRRGRPKAVALSTWLQALVAATTAAASVVAAGGRTHMPRIVEQRSTCSRLRLSEADEAAGGWRVLVLVTTEVRGGGAPGSKSAGDRGT